MNNELNIFLEKFLQKQASLYDEKWEQASFDPEPEVEDRIWSRLQQQIAPVSPNRLSLWNKYSRMAAALLIPLFLVGLSYFYFKDKSTLPDGAMIVKVDVGQKANMQLPDGTQIWLNSASSLTYDNTYNQKERIIHLQGEAYFEVHKDKTKPFIVKTGEISVEALGTSFNVKAYPEDDCVTTTLIEGSVKVSNPFLSEVLMPDEKLSFYKSKQQFAKTVLLDAERNISWTNNQLSFEQERLEDIAKTLERMYNVQVRFASENLENIRFSGTIKNNNLDGILQLISFVSPIRYTMDNDSTIVIRKKIKTKK